MSEFDKTPQLHSQPSDPSSIHSNNSNLFQSEPFLFHHQNPDHQALIPDASESIYSIQIKEPAPLSFRSLTLESEIDFIDGLIDLTDNRSQYSVLVKDYSSFALVQPKRYSFSSGDTSSKYDEIIGRNGAGSLVGIVDGDRPRITQSFDRRLDATDNNNPTRPGRYSDDYLLSSRTSGLVQIDLTSDEFDTYLQVIAISTGTVIDFDDDGGIGLNSRLVFDLQAEVEYIVRTTSYGVFESGNYTIDVNPLIPSVPEFTSELDEPDFDSTSIPAPTPNPVSGDIIGSKPNPSPGPLPKPLPSPIPSPDPGIDPIPDPELILPPKPDPTIDPNPEPVPSPIPEPAPDPTPIPAPLPTSPPLPAPDPDPNPVPDPIPSPMPEPEPGMGPDPEPLPILDPAPNPMPDPAPNPVPNPIPNPDPVLDSGLNPTLPTSPDLSLTVGFDFIYGYGLINAAEAVDQSTDQSVGSVISPFAVVDGESYSIGNNLINAPEVWQRGHTGGGIVVAVVDTGVDWTHFDLNDNIWQNDGEILGNGIDDDGNGFVDDVRGWDFAENDNDPRDFNGHGTHVAGIIAAENNGFGVTGVAYNAQIMPLRVLGRDGSGSPFTVANGIRYATDNGADVINLSLGSNILSPIVQSAVQYAAEAGVVVVMAAGNDGNPRPGYPAGLATEWGISVGAVDETQSIASFSNWAGGDATLQHVVAPGVSIESTAPGGGFQFLSGTSMAAPHVAGTVALMLSANSNLTPTEVRQILTQSTTSIDSSLVSPAPEDISFVPLDDVLVENPLPDGNNNL